MRSNFIIFITIIFSVFNLHCQSTQYTLIKDQSDLTILSPSLKDRKTARIRLSNGLKVYLISDKHADKSAAAIGVLAGSWDDPSKFPGMAHFCEHMLFQGSKKYPKENEYFQYIFDNSGDVNAFTSLDRTVYMFAINHNSFEGALDRLAYFFKDPIFEPNSIAKELYAVDQEHSKNIENDYRRANMVQKEAGNPNHPNAKFSTGNAKTLQSIPPSELRKWYEQHYSANLMALTIYSSLDLNQLIKMTIEKFSQIPNIGKDPLNIKENIFLKENTGRAIYIKPISNLQILCLEWELEPEFINDETKSVELIAYALKRGQKHSLSETLKKEQLAEDLDIAAYKVGSLHSLLSFEIKLTDKGAQNHQTVIKRCFEAINNLKQMGIPKYIFNEMQTMAKLNYQYQAHEDAFDFVCNHTTALLDEDLSTYPKKTILATKYSSANILKILNNLKLENCYLSLIADPKKLNITLDKKEKWIQAEYSINDFSSSFKNEIAQNPTNDQIKVPEPNYFIPSNLKIASNKEDNVSSKQPVEFVFSDFGKIYYLKDTLYQTPQISWHFTIKDKIFNNTLKNTVLKDLYIKALNDRLESVFFSANAAGLFPEILSDTFGIKIKIFGYSEKASYLLEEILKNINTLEVLKEDFDIYYSSLSKDYENEQKILPVFQAQQYLLHVLFPYNYTYKEKLDQLNTLTYKDFTNFKDQAFQNTYIEGFLTGNLTLKTAESTWLDIKDILTQNAFPTKEHYKKQLLALSDQFGPYVIHKKIDQLGNGVILSLDQNDFSFSNRASQNILSLALKEAFFTELRSKQKTAYIAHSFDIEIEKKLSQLFIVQSNSHDVNDLLVRFEIFIENYLDNLETLIPEERFAKIKTSLIEKLENPYNNLNDMSNFYNNLAFEYNADFLWLDKRLEAVKNLKYADFIAFTKKCLSKDNKKRIAVLFEGKIDKSFKYNDVSLDLLKIGKTVSAN